MKFNSPFSTLLVATALTGAVFGENLFQADTMLDFERSSKLTMSESQEDVFILKPGADGRAFSVKKLKIDPQKQYQISGEFRLQSGAPAKIFIGYAPFTVQGYPIAPPQVSVRKGTATVLTAPAAVGDKVIKVKDASRWQNNSSYGYVAFKAQADWSDLPNYNTWNIIKGGIKKVGDDWEIKLNIPLTKAYKTGTPVRQHRDGGTYIYNGQLTTLGAQWSKCTSVITGRLTHGASNQKFWPGTQYVKVIILALGGQKDTVIEFRNIKVDLIK